jgi:hypothetical protein
MVPARARTPTLIVPYHTNMYQVGIHEDEARLAAKHMTSGASCQQHPKDLQDQLDGLNHCKIHRTQQDRDTNRVRLLAAMVKTECPEVDQAVVGRSRHVTKQPWRLSKGSAGTSCSNVHTHHKQTVTGHSTGLS